MKTKIVPFKPTAYRTQFIHFIAFTMIFLFLSTQADAQTATKLQSVYDWAKPIVNIILAIATLYAAGKLVMKAFVKHEEAGWALVWFIVALVVWGLWLTFAPELLRLVGGPSINF